MAGIVKKTGAGDRVDSSARESLEAQLKSSGEKIAVLEAIKSAMPDPYYVRNMDYNIILWPASIAELTGYSEAEARRMKCYEIFKAAVCPPGNKCPTQRCVTVRRFLKDVAVDVYHKSGKTVHSLVSNAGIYDNNGNSIGAVEIVKDNTIVDETLSSIGETIKKIEEASGILNAAMKDVQNYSIKVNENAQDSLGDIKKGVETGNSVSGKTSESSRYAGSAQETMKSINESMRFSVEKISSLKTKAELIVDFIKVIQDISAKTNLLAINASIEAAHAGEAGRGFKVVADGIRELSKNSQESSLSIQATIQEINNLIKEATNLMNVTENDIEKGSQTISGLLKFVNEIDASIEALMRMIRAIENSAGASSEMIGEQNKSVNEVSNVGHELYEISKKLSTEFDIISKAIKHIDMG